MAINRDQLDSMMAESIMLNRAWEKKMRFEGTEGYQNPQDVSRSNNPAMESEISAWESRPSPVNAAIDRNNAAVIDPRTVPQQTGNQRTSRFTPPDWRMEYIFKGQKKFDMAKAELDKMEETYAREQQQKGSGTWTVSARHLEAKRKEVREIQAKVNDDIRRNAYDVKEAGRLEQAASGATGGITGQKGGQPADPYGRDVPEYIMPEGEEAIVPGIYEKKRYDMDTGELIPGTRSFSNKGVTRGLSLNEKTKANTAHLNFLQNTILEKIKAGKGEEAALMKNAIEYSKVKDDMGNESVDKARYKEFMKMNKSQAEQPKGGDELNGIPKEAVPTKGKDGKMYYGDGKSGVYLKDGKPIPVTEKTTPKPRKRGGAGGSFDKNMTIADVTKFLVKNGANIKRAEKIASSNDFIDESGNIVDIESFKKAAKAAGVAARWTGSQLMNAWSDFINLPVPGTSAY